MTDDGERQLHEQFRVLRHHAGAGAPEFRDVVAGLVWRRESAGRRRGRVAGLAVAAAAALLLFAVLRPGGRRMVLVDLDAARWEAPTDFLLRTPGAELLRAVPRLILEGRLLP